MRATPLVRGLAISMCSVAAVACVEPSDMEEFEQLELRDAVEPATSSLEGRCWAVTLPQGAPDGTPCDPGTDDRWKLHGDKGMFRNGYVGRDGFGLGDDEVPLLLSSFCLYEWTGPDLDPLPLEGIDSSPVSLDCPAVVPLGNDLTKTLHEPLKKAFLAHVGGHDLPTPPNPVDVAVVDTRSDLGPAPVEYEHADAVADVIEALACGDADPCPVEVHHALALPLRADGTSGGSGEYGARAHVALGVMEAVTRWKRKYAGLKHRPPLVINLSVGWVTEASPVWPVPVGGTEAEPWWVQSHAAAFRDFVNGPVRELPFDSRVAVEALHGALLYASCSGALIVASAGNAEDDSCNEQPVAPAVWANYPAPNETTCKMLGFETPPEELHAGKGAPLVVPVAALRYDDRPIGATRPGSLTSLMAPGYHVATEFGRTPLTGTSMSAAAVSAAIALVWAHWPDEKRDTVLSGIREYSPPIALTPELREYGASPTHAVRRLSICSIFGSCADVGPQPPIEAALDELEFVIAELPPADEQTSISEQPLLRYDCMACMDSVVAYVPSDPDSRDHWYFSACRFLDTEFEFDATHPALSGPHPDRPICPDCPLRWNASTSSYVADLQIDPVFRSSTWSGLNIVIAGASGRHSTIDLQAQRDRLQIGRRLAVDLGPASADARSIRINLVTTDGADTVTRGNELLLVR